MLTVKFFQFSCTLQIFRCRMLGEIVEVKAITMQWLISWHLQCSQIKGFILLFSTSKNWEVSHSSRMIFLYYAFFSKVSDWVVKLKGWVVLTWMSKVKCSWLGPLKGWWDQHQMELISVEMVWRQFSYYYFEIKNYFVSSLVLEFLNLYFPGLDLGREHKCM